MFSFPSAAAAAAADDDYNPVLRLTTPEEESNTCSIRSLSISPKFYEMPPGLCDEKHKPEEKKLYQLIDLIATVNPAEAQTWRASRFIETAK